MSRLIKSALVLMLLSTLGLAVYLQLRAPASGVDILIVNATQADVSAHITLLFKEGGEMRTLELALPGTPARGRNLVSHALDLDTQPFNISVELYSSASAQPIHTLVGAWPGEAGMSDGAGSNRVLVQIEVRDTGAGPTLVFTGLL